MCKGKQQMKFWKLASAVTILVLSTSVNAAYIKNADVITNQDTGMEWLALSATAGLSYNEALIDANTNHGSGWVYAQQADVEALMYDFFPNYSQTSSSRDGGQEFCPESGCYDSDRRQAAELFYGLFGTARYQSIQNTGELMQTDYATGLVMSPLGTWTQLSTYGIKHRYRTTTGYDTDTLNTYMDYAGTTPDTFTGSEAYGIWMVQDVSAVPVPAAVWLFGSGLIGLVGMARRKKA